MQRPELPDDQRTKLGQTILNEVQRLNDLTTDFLELSRLESGRMHFKREPVHLGGLVQESLELVRAQAESKEIRLETEIDESLVPVHGDRKILKQLVLNLLTNAIKYSNPGDVVTVALQSKGDEVQLEVRDTGRGISPEDQERLFQRFFRANTDDNVQGTGLGLVIAKRIAESHEGSISVESTLGEGATFTVTLPVETSATLATRPRS